MLSGFKQLHFVGIGGVGMSGLATVLADRGFHITGSDRQESRRTQGLRSRGIRVDIGHRRDNAAGAQALVVSSAVKDDNPEVEAAKESGIPILRRMEVLSELMNEHYSIAVAGTHGKTTTTAILCWTLIKGGLDPTCLIGGEAIDIGTNARSGRGVHLVAEVDESDGLIARLSPKVAVVTNVEEEHLDFYSDAGHIVRTFRAFLENVPDDGLVILGRDNPNLGHLIEGTDREPLTYGLDVEDATVWARDVSQNMMRTDFRLIVRGDSVGKFSLRIPGRHNLYNALPAVIVGLELGLDLSAIKEAIESFSGVERRFEIKGIECGVLVVDDYAHNPTKVRTTLASIKEGWGESSRVICIFQPHLYSRSKHLAVDFGRAFHDADTLIITDVYAAREAPIEGITGKIIADEAIRNGHPSVDYIANIKDVVPFLMEEGRIGQDDIVITMGAGDVWKVADELVSRLKAGN